MVLEILVFVLAWRQWRLEREKLRLEADLLRLQTSRLQHQADEPYPLIVRATQTDIERYGGMGTQRLHDQVHRFMNERMQEDEKSPRLPIWCQLVAGVTQPLAGWKLRPMTSVLPAR